MIPKLQQDLPADVNIDVANDNSLFIDRSVKNVYHTIGEAIVLVALVIFVFLRTVRASIIPIVTIPVSLIGTFAMMALAGFTINTLTLLALVLAIGLVVDDAIVMLENIFRHIEEGLDPFSAAIKGAREIGFAVITMTLTLVAVYAPLAFTPGRTGRLFVEFALALAGAVLVSGFVALTLTPMMCSKLLRHNPKPNWFDRGMERVLTGHVRPLRPAAALGADRPARATAQGPVRAACCRRAGSWSASWCSARVAIAFVFPTMKSELSPLEDRGTIIANINAPDGATSTTPTATPGRSSVSARSTPSSTASSPTSATPRCRRAASCTARWTGKSASAPRWRSRATWARASTRWPGVSAFPITPPSLGQGFRERPRQLRDPDLRQLREPEPGGARDARRDRQEPRHPGAWTSTCA